MNDAVILYVEDEADDVFFMRRAFEQEGLAGHLRAVTDGGDAIAYLEAADQFPDSAENPLPHLILLDLNLPVRSGFEVLQWIRSQDTTKDLPVVVFSSSNHNADRERANALGANEYLLKPSSGLDFAKIVQMLKNQWLPNSVSNNQ